MIINIIPLEYFPEQSKVIRHSSGAAVLVPTVCCDISAFATLCLSNVVCAGMCQNNVRNTKKFQSISLLQFDFDNGTTVDEVLPYVRRHNHAIVGSANHMKDKGDGHGVLPRFHVFLELDKPITIPEIYKHMYFAVMNRGKWKPDKSCSDVVRYFYIHSTILSVKTDGLLLDTSKATEHYYRELAKPKVVVEIPKQITITESDANYFAFQLKKENRFAEGIFQSVLGKLKRRGFTEDDAYNFLVSVECLHDNPKHPINTKNARSYIQWAWRTW